MAADLSELDLLAIQIDGMRVTGDLILLAAIGIDGEGVKYPLGLLEGATENAAVVQPLVARWLDPNHSSVVDGRRMRGQFVGCSSSSARKR
jgi:hypothetical protein